MYLPEGKEKDLVKSNNSNDLVRRNFLPTFSTNMTPPGDPSNILSIQNLLRYPQILPHSHILPANDDLINKTFASINYIGVNNHLFGCNKYFLKRLRSEKKPIPDEKKDDKYYERRKRNNLAAKKSRDARKLREDQIALKATLLEHENAILKTQVLTLREEATALRMLLSQQKKLTTPDSLLAVDKC